MIEYSQILHNELEIPDLKVPGGFCAVFGPNGSGKSTLLRLTSGITIPDSGKITINGSSPREIDCGYISEFPDKNIVFERVRDEISSPLKFSHTSCEEMEERFGFLIDKFGISGIAGRNITKLSGGEKTLVSLATAIAGDPDLLIIDEADSHLDEDTASQVFDIIKSLDIPDVLFCTQNMNRVMEIAGHAIYLENGNVAVSGRPEEVFENLEGTCFCPNLRETDLL